MSQARFQYLTELPNSFFKSEAQYDEKAQKELKDQLNTLLSANKQKQSNLLRLKKLVEDQRKQEYDQLIITEKSDIISSLLSKVLEKERISKQEALEQAILINKRENLKVITCAMRGKLIELQKNFERITTNYSAFNNSSFASKYSLLLINKSLEEYQHHFETAKSLFILNKQKLERRLRTASEQNSRMIRRASSVDVEFEQKKKIKQKFLNQYSSCLNDFHELEEFRKKSSESLKEYKRKFSMIKAFIEGSWEYLSDFDETLIRKIIQKLKELEYRSESLKFTYQKLSEQEAKLNSELSGYASQLSSVKISAEFPSTSSNLFLFQTKSSAHLPDLEYLIIKNYFQFAEVLYVSIECFNPKLSLDPDIESKFNKTIEILKEIRLGVVKRRPFQLERIVAEKLIGKKDHNELRMDVLNSMALNRREIKDMFVDFFGKKHNEELKALIYTVESSPIIKNFLDKETLRRFLVKHENNSVNDLAVNLEVKCHLILQDKVKAFANESLYLLVALAKTVKRETAGKVQANLFVPMEFKMKKARTQSNSPYKATEKVTKKPSETQKPEPVVIESVATSYSSAPRVYTLTSTALKRQKVMKEVLENQKKEMLLRTIEKKISKHSEKNLNLPYMKKFVLRSSSNLTPLLYSSRSSRKFINYQ